MDNGFETTPTNNFWLNALKSLWGFFPIFLIILFIVFFTLKSQIESKTKDLEEEKLQQLKGERPALNVVVLNILPQNIQDRINLPGITEPWLKVSLASEVRGIVLKKEVKEGDIVTKGATIAIIDSKDYGIALSSAQATLEAALASRNRLQKLYDGKLSTRSQLDNAIARVKTSQAAVESATLNFDRCVIKSKVSGLINDVFFEEGEYVNVATKTCEIIQIDRLKVKIGIPESDVNAIRKVKHVVVQVDALDKRKFKGHVYYLSSIADPMAHLYELTVEIPNSKNEILPDMFTRVEIIKKEIQNALAIPLYAVVSRDDKYFVFIVDEKDGLVKIRQVELGLQDGWLVQVTKGINVNEKIIVMGHRSVNDGQKVHVIRTITDIKELNT